MKAQGDFIGHGPCEACGSSDAKAYYSNGSAFCFSCETYFRDQDADEVTFVESKSSGMIPVGEVSAWRSRGLSEQTCSKWGISISYLGDEQVRIFNYRNLQGRLVAQKVRKKGKKHKFLGDTKNAGLYGQHLWRDQGKKVVITEGEIDAASVSQAQNHKWPVVSVPNGAPGAKKAIEKNIEWLEGFEEIVLMFDQDEPGRTAADECAILFKPGKCKIAKLPLKDANDMIMAGRTGEIIDAIWGAKTFRPDGIVTIADIKDQLQKPIDWGLPWWTDNLTQLTYGRRYGENYAFGAGTGIGKTDFLLQQVAYDVVELGEKVGLFLLEMDPTEAVRRTAGKHAGKPFHLPDGSWTQQDFDEAVDDLEARNLVYLYNHFGSCDWDVIEKRIRYLARSEGVRLIYLDHLTALVAHADDERKALEGITADIASLCKELKIIIHFVSHLTAPDKGPPHEEGGRVMIRHFKGSRAIGYWSHYMFGMERNPHAEDLDERKQTIFRILKSRYNGSVTGEVVLLGYDASTTQLFEIEEDKDFTFTDDERKVGDAAASLY